MKDKIDQKIEELKKKELELEEHIKILSQIFHNVASQFEEIKRELENKKHQ